jgi:hypothetical protein
MTKETSACCLEARVGLQNGAPPPALGHTMEADSMFHRSPWFRLGMPRLGGFELKSSQNAKWVSYGFLGTLKSAATSQTN